MNHFGPGDDLLLEDALDLGEWLVGLKRTVPPELWVENLRAEAEAASLASLR